MKQKAKYEEFTVRVNEEIESASNMSTEAQTLAQAEELRVELKHVDELLYLYEKSTLIISSASMSRLLYF